MKRRDFLKKAGLAVVAAPILGRVIEATPSQVVDDTSQVIPHDPYFFPAKYSMDPFFATSEFDDLKRIQEFRPNRVFVSLGRQTTYLQEHFAKHAEWQEFIYGKWQLPTGDVVVRQTSQDTRISFLSRDMIVRPGAIIVSCPRDQIRIVHTSGNELDRFWRPVLIPHDRVYTVGYRDNLLLACDKRPELGTVVAFTFAGPRYTIIEASPVATGVCSVLLDRPLEAKVFSNKYWIVKHWHRVMRAITILDHSLRTVTLG